MSFELHVLLVTNQQLDACKSMATNQSHRKIRFEKASARYCYQLHHIADQYIWLDQICQQNDFSVQPASACPVTLVLCDPDASISSRSKLRLVLWDFNDSNVKLTNLQEFDVRDHRCEIRTWRVVWLLAILTICKQSGHWSLRGSGLNGEIKTSI